jgi:DNA sulfur modification protein DndC
MESMVDNGEEWMEPLLEFRNELASHRDPSKKRELREIKRRNGKIYRKADGTPIPGPYKFKQRKKMLTQLLKLQKEIQETGPDPDTKLIRDEELQEIRRLWRTELQDWEDSLPAIYEKVYQGQSPIQWSDADVTTLHIDDAKLLSESCESEELPWRLLAKLIDLERDMQGMTKRAGIFKKIDRIFSEDWLEEQALEKQFEIEDREEDQYEVA